ncbi:MAG TPA: hypothetical protein EYP04_04180 [Anaerolineae bacterium]|nr:hypothetical protein [Anaerolineae bacterium]
MKIRFIARESWIVHSAVAAMLIVALLSAVIPMAFAASDANSQSVDLLGFTVTFIEAKDNGDGTYTWTYKITSDDDRHTKALSHWALQLCHEAGDAIVPEDFDEYETIGRYVDMNGQEHTGREGIEYDVEVGVDRTTGISGIVYEDGSPNLGDNGQETDIFQFTLRGDFGVEEVGVGIKAGRNVAVGVINGPSCASAETPTPTPTDTPTPTPTPEPSNSGVRVSKTLLEPADGQVLAGIGETVVFQIVVENTGGASWVFLPLNDYYDPEGCLALHGDKVGNPVTSAYDDLTGEVHWRDLTDAFGTSLAPGERFTVTLSFDAVVPEESGWTSGTYINEAEVYQSTDGVPATDDGGNALAAPATDSAAVICYAPASIGNYVWYDANRNGVQDSGEGGIQGIEVELFDSSDNLIATTTTDGDGAYQFTNLFPGTYRVKIADSNFSGSGVLVGYGVSLQDQGGDDAVDSDGDPVSHDVTVHLMAGQQEETIDFGFIKASIGDYVWHDTNADGNQDVDEAGIPGVVLRLYQDADGDGSYETLVAQQTTDGDGAYDFTDLLAGSYRLDVDESSLPAGVTLTTNNEPYDYILGPGEDHNDADFGYEDTGRIGDLVWYDQNGDGLSTGEAGLANVVVELYDSGQLIASTQTNQNGVYWFSGLPAGDYVVAIADSNFAPGGPLEGYHATTTEPMTITLSPGNSVDDADFGFAGLGGINGTVFYDWDEDGVQGLNESGIADVSVTLFQDTDRDGSYETEIATATTDAGGFYQFDDLMPGPYKVAETDPAGTHSTTDNTRYVELVVPPAGGNATDNDFGDILKASIQVRTFYDNVVGNGTYDDGEVPVSFVAISVVGQTVAGPFGTSFRTDVDGRYLLENLLPGTYTVTAASLQGFRLVSDNPQQVIFEIADGDGALFITDFGYVAPTAVQLASFVANATLDQVTVQWNTLSEENIVGFHVWRGANAKGPNLRLTTKPVPAVGSGSNYTWIDDQVQPGSYYWYWLEAVPDGTFYGPVAVTVPASDDPGPGFGGKHKLFLPFVGR